MLRQLARLTRRVPAAGATALAVAVYASEEGETIGARETGVEGVACVDDAARAVVLLLRLWKRTGNDQLRLWAEGLLDFVLWMHDGEGRWINFIYDWGGRSNLRGPTSAPGSNFWQARAMEALAVATNLVQRPDAAEVLRKALAVAAESRPAADVRSLHAVTALELLGSSSDPWLVSQLAAWCDELAACSEGTILMNAPDERGLPHLWGHIQEAVLAESARVTGRPALLDVARRSADALFIDLIAGGFDLPHSQPYGVQSAILVMDRLALETGDKRYEASAEAARSWFHGRNPAGVPVYDREESRVADGIDNGTVNQHSGAEANISGGLALIADPLLLAEASAWTVPW